MKKLTKISISSMLTGIWGVASAELSWYLFYNTLVLK